MSYAPPIRHRPCDYVMQRENLQRCRISHRVTCRSSLTWGFSVVSRPAARRSISKSLRIFGRIPLAALRCTPVTWEILLQISDVTSICHRPRENDTETEILQLLNRTRCRFSPVMSPSGLLSCGSAGFLIDVSSGSFLGTWHFPLGDARSAAFPGSVRGPDRALGVGPVVPSAL
jgi:hypothetical protein